MYQVEELCVLCPLQDGLTPLWAAAKGAHAMVARELLTAGANKEARTKVRGGLQLTRGWTFVRTAEGSTSLFGMGGHASGPFRPA